MKCALIVGGDSRLGTALREELELLGVQVVSTTRRPPAPASGRWVYLDLLDISQILVDGSFYSGWTVYIVAAVTGFGPSERGADAWRVNADAPGIIARHVGRDNRVVFASSDAVEFAPHTAYAKQKAYAELAVLAAGGSVLRCGPISATSYASAARALIELAGLYGGTLQRWPA